MQPPLVPPTRYDRLAFELGSTVCLTLGTSLFLPPLGFIPSVLTFLEKGLGHCLFCMDPPPPELRGHSMQWTV